MDFLELDIPGVWVFNPRIHKDSRGVFLESFTRSSLIQAAGRGLTLAQANISKSQYGTVRGLHFASVPPGQAKYVQCVAGSIFDVIVDIRVGSATFGQWAAVTLNDEDHHGVFISEGLAHGFAALTGTATIAYFCSEPYRPSHEHGIDPFDDEIGIDWPVETPIVSDRDGRAPSLADAAQAGLLPRIEECEKWQNELHEKN